MINDWVSQWEQAPLKSSHLPKRGFLVDDVACIFLIKTDCQVGLIDFFISNPKTTEEVRKQAFDLLWPMLENEARKLKLQKLIASTPVIKVMGLAMHYGMIGDPEPYYFFRKILTTPSQGEVLNGSNGNNSERSAGL